MARSESSTKRGMEAGGMKTGGKKRMGIALAAVGLVAVGCGSARRAAPLVGPRPAASVEQQAGRRVFLDKCDYCHPGGEGGLGPALNNKPLPRTAIKVQVRQGLGAMPDFSDQELPGADLERLADYVIALRRNR
jgi:mono/diheme cytochrome c family protein